jgi:hypothetical protein
LLTVELNVRINGSVQTQLIHNYAPPAAVESVNPTFQQRFKIFDDIIEKNTSSFEEQIKKGLKLEEIARTPENFFGKINGKVGCLLYPKDYQQTQDPRLSMCGSFLCNLAKVYEGCEIADFVRENAGNSKLNTLSYSRMIYAINYHANWFRDLLDLNLSFRKDRHACLSDLSKLLEIVTT